MEGMKLIRSIRLENLLSYGPRTPELELEPLNVFIGPNASGGWKDPGVGDTCCQLMVQTVEAWLIADRDASEKYYGKRFHPGALPVRTDVEAISKAELLRSLQ